MRTYGYIRTNSPNQQAKIDLQRAAIEKAAESLGLAIDGWYLDESTDPDILERPAMASLANQMSDGDAIIVSSADRVARTAERLLMFMDWADDRGVKVHWADLIGAMRPVYAFNTKNAMGIMHHVQVFLNMDAATGIVRKALDADDDSVGVNDVLSFKIRRTGLG